MGLCLHLRYQGFETTMGFVDIACQFRKIGVQVDFRTGEASVAGVPAHIQQLHPTFLEFREHEMPHFVWSQLWQVEFIAHAIKNIFHRPLANGLAWVSLRVREKNGALRSTTVALDESSTISLDVLFEAAPGGMRQNNGAGQTVFRHFGPNGNGMRAPVDII